MEYPMIEAIEKQLQQEEQACFPMSRAEFEERQASRAALHGMLETVDKQVKALSKCFHRLPKLPGVAHVQWASAVLRFPNFVFLVIDTTGVREDSDIIRVLIADPDGTSIFDRLYARSASLVSLILVIPELSITRSRTRQFWRIFGRTCKRPSQDVMCWLITWIF